MPDTYKRSNIGLVAFCPEVTQGVKNCYCTQGAVAASTTTTCIDTAVGTGAAGYDDENLLGMEDDFLNGLYIKFDADTTTAALRGKKYKITDSTEDGTKATLTVEDENGDPMPDTPVNGDSFLIYAELPASNISDDLDPAEDLPRDDFHRLTQDPPPSLPGLPSCKISFDCEIPGLETPSADGTAAGIDRFSQFLKCIGTRTAKVGEALIAGSTASVLKMTDESPYGENDHALVSGQVRRVTTTDAVGHTATVSPDLSSAPAAAVVFYAAEQWSPDDDGHQTHTILYLKDDQMYELIGCVGQMTATMQYGKLQKFNFSFEGDSYNSHDMGDDAAPWDSSWNSATVTSQSSQSSKGPVPFTAGAAYWGTTALPLNEATVDLGVGMEPTMDTVGGKEIRATTRASKMTLKFRNTNDTPLDTWVKNKAQFRVLLQAGNASGACVAFSANGQAESVKSSDVGKILHHDMAVRCVDDQSDVDLAYKLLLLRF